MRTLFSLALIGLCFSLTAQETINYPYNPDGDVDGTIALHDLLDILGVYGSAFTPTEIQIDGVGLADVIGQLQATVEAQQEAINAMQVAAGGANIWYQSWDMLNYAHWGAAGSDPAPNGCGSPGMVYYHGFVAPATGIYNKLEVQIGHTTDALTDPGAFVGGIYKDAGGVPSANAMLTNSQSPHDGTTGGIILTPSAAASAFVGPLTEGGVTWCDFTSGANLTKGEVYWVAVKWNKPSGSELRITLNTDETSFVPEHYKYSYMSDSVPAVATINDLPDPATGVVQNIKANFWFRISGP